MSQDGIGDSQWLEEGLRTALLLDGSRLLESLLQCVKPADDRPLPGEKCHHNRPLVIQTLLGPVKLLRNYYYHPAKGAGVCGRCPLDKALGLFEHVTPGLAKIASRAAAESSYQQASEDLAQLAGIQMHPRQLQRLCQNVGATLREKLKRLPPPPPPKSLPVLYVEMDGTGVPMNRAALQGRQGRGPDGSAKTREVKLCCVFTQSGLDKNGDPVRDEASTTWVAGFETASDFGPRARDEAVRRGAARARRTVLLGDGAAWIWELARTCFPEATCILDFWHASQYLATMAALVNPGDKSAADALYDDWRGKMRLSQISQVLAQARGLQAGLDVQSAAWSEMEKCVNYLQNQQSRMDYAAYRKDGLFIGSGVVEAGCKKVIGARFKASGMFWGEPGARNLLQIRTALLSQNRFNEFWEARAAA